MSTEQHNQQSNTSQQTDRASPSPHRRSVSQHNSSSNPEHIASRFRHRRSFTGSDQRSPISHVARSVTHHLLRRLSFAPSLVACSVACRSSLGLGLLRSSCVDRGRWSRAISRTSSLPSVNWKLAIA